MSAITNEKLRLKGPVSFEFLTKITLSQTPNKHGKMTVGGNVNMAGIGNVLSFVGQAVSLYEIDENGDDNLSIFMLK